MLALPTYGAINLHFSLLPRWRGAAPVQRALMAGDTETGVSVMQMDEGLDTGPVLNQLAEAIRPEDDAGTLGARLAHLGARLLVGVLRILPDGRLPARPQDGRLATAAPRIGPADRVIDWRRQPEQIARQVRALAPEPGASTTFRGQTLKVLQAAPDHEGGRARRARRVGGRPRRARRCGRGRGAPGRGGASGPEAYGRGRVGARRSFHPDRAARMSPSRPTARSVALEVLVRVIDEGAYSNRALPAALGRSGLDARDRAFATALTLGTLRRKLPLDGAIERVANRPIARMTPAARSALRLGAYQLLDADVPAHAAVSETVDLVGARERGFVNAVLRRLVREPGAAQEGDDAASIEARTGLARWAVEELATVVGDETAEAAAALAAQGPLSLR